MLNADRDISFRVLLLAPTAKDAEVTRTLLTRGGLTCFTCENLPALTRELHAGAGAALLTEETLTAPGINELLALIEQQPAWSEVPIVMLMRGGVQSPVAARVLGALRNVTVLERPAPMRSVISAVQAAVRGRRRQYEIRDYIDAIRRSEAILRASETRFRQLQQQLAIAVDASQLGTFHCEMPLGKIIWNDRCKAHFWLPPDAEIDFDLFYSILHPDDRQRTRAAVEACVEKGQPYDIEYRTVSPRGAERWVRATGRTYYDEHHNPIRFDGTTQDITERKKSERERETLLESERAARAEAERANRLKDEFLATVSHELRTPLNAILGWAQMLTRLTHDPEEITAGLEVIERNARLQAQLIDDLLDMSRIISGKIRLEVRPVEMSSIIDSAIESVRPAADAKEIRIHSIVDPAGPVLGDSGRLQQVLWNLLTNSVKFTPKGGKIAVALQRIASQVEISVTDTGRGIAPEFVGHVFERFRQADGSITREHGGLGLGLAIVKQLVELHGGTVSAASPGIGQGATFTVRLPLIAVRHEAIQPESAHPRALAAGPFNCESANLAGVKVLVVDDDADARQLVKRLLTECKAEVTTAASGPEALALLDHSHPDVLLSDIGMPLMDGYEFIRKVRAARTNGNSIPAAALTAFARSEDRRRALLAGYQSHVAKPVEPAELIAVVASLAGRTNPAVEPRTR